jgi:phosphoribosylformimino-5-aminoimidazole carboxamide ribotide isomerase
MRVIPAIDLRGGLCVRLRQGDYGQETVFGDDPAEMAARWESAGASLIHLVDLDGAKAGRPVNIDSVRRIIGRVNVPCQLGGGVRDQKTISTSLDAGIDRVIVGTQALVDPDWFRSMIEIYPGRLILGLDARDSKVATQGWLHTSSVNPAVLARQFKGSPLAAIIYTDITRDGTLQGPNVEATRALVESVEAPVIASGGVGSLEHLALLATLPIAGCIVGRALYEGRFSLAEAILRVESVSSRSQPISPPIGR